MKKGIIVGLLVVSLLALTQQPASAWVNSRFSIGLNWDWQTANNSFLWGAWRNGQIPCPDGGFGLPQAPAPYYPPSQNYSYSAPAYGAPYSAAPSYYPGAYAATPAPYAAPPYAGTPVPYGSPYQFAAYPRESYYYQPSPWSYNGN